MDPVTHAITGKLLGDGFFSERHGRVATFAAIFGAVIPDVDIVAEAFSHDPLALIKYHRGITHSFVALPFFAALLAGLTRWITRRRGIPAPSWATLTVIYGVGISSHIVLDGLTSFGTRLWTPISQERVAWDLLFIIDLTLTSIGLLPQVAAWIYRDRGKTVSRASFTWLLFTVGAFGAWLLTRSIGFPFHLWAAALASAAIAALFFLPSLRGWGVRVTRANWCRAGVAAMVFYIVACGIAHHAAIRRVADFASANHIAVQRLGALPLPPSLFDWGGVLRSTDGVYASRFDLRSAQTPAFHFTADSPPDEYVARAMQLPEVELYWSFARFPIIRTAIEGSDHVVEFFDQRFITREGQRRHAFTYRVVFDGAGKLVEEGWQSNGMFLRRRKTFTPRSGDAP